MHCCNTRIDSSLSSFCPEHLSSLPGGAYLPVPHSRHTLCANAGFFASIQQNTGFCRSSSQHGLVSGKVGVAVGGLVGEEVGAMVGHSFSRLVPVVWYPFAKLPYV